MKRSWRRVLSKRCSHRVISGTSLGSRAEEIGRPASSASRAAMLISRAAMLVSRAAVLASRAAAGGVLIGT